MDAPAIHVEERTLTRFEFADDVGPTITALHGRSYRVRLLITERTGDTVSTVEAFGQPLRQDGEPDQRANGDSAIPLSVAGSVGLAEFGERLKADLAEQVEQAAQAAV